MIRELRIANLKGFRGEHHIRLAPLTLIYGSNSAGKSSLIQSLLLLKQTIESSDPEQPELVVRGALADIMAPLRACLTTAVREGLIRSNPARDADLPHRPTVEDMEDDEAKAMSRDELAEMLALVPEQWHLFFWFLAATGIRISEAVALQWRHLALDAAVPHVKVRRALVKGRMGPLKSR
jgi:integrase